MFYCSHNAQLRKWAYDIRTAPNTSLTEVYRKILCREDMVSLLLCPSVYLSIHSGTDYLLHLLYIKEKKYTIQKISQSFVIWHLPGCQIFLVPHRLPTGVAKYHKGKLNTLNLTRAFSFAGDCQSWGTGKEAKSVHLGFNRQTKPWNKCTRIHKEISWFHWTWDQGLDKQQPSQKGYFKNPWNYLTKMNSLKSVGYT